MVEPLNQWVCDKCGELIEKPIDGYVIWKHDDGGDYQICDIKIIHHLRCDLKGYGESMHLGKFLGVDGLSELLSMIDLGPIRHGLGQTGGQGFKDHEEFVDFVRRVQIPHYEEARQYFNEPEVLEYYSDANEYFPYLPESLRHIIDMCGK